ncbi:MAG: tyrosine--tRNA ligase [candidate division WOR-3 bacterium]|nr:tyrosine--tRNA ligase [candidate division WOR-3 bacterium]MCX7757458.1 tyrosine--tRNA ligase [candidate division WOR-3 bacterium]MDW7987901.1 tyrosine--tRNA ligase [candidate division WOR-3 bacterium]
MTIDEQLKILTSRTDCIVSLEELREKLILSEKQNRPLRVKLGIDASGPDIHLGFAVVLRKLRQFQELGHIAVLIIGDFTGMIGDPTGRSKTRPALSEEQIKTNMARYREQIFKILIPERTEFRNNSEWLGKLSSKDIINLTSRYTVARILEREDFKNRLISNQPLYIHEILYPLFQGYDSVMVQADIELGGADQYWNLLVGRELQREFNQPEQVIITVPLLEGTDGKLKMSKSYNNYIGITEPAREIYGKIMSIPDELIIKYFWLCTNLSDDEILKLEERMRRGENPKIFKELLGKEIVTLYYSPQEADEVQKEFEAVFKLKQAPQEIPEFKLKSGTEINIVDLLVLTKSLPSKSEARRKIKEGAIEIDGKKVSDIYYVLTITDPKILKIGKHRFLKIVPE